MTNGEKIKEIFPDAEFDNAKPFTDGRWETMNLDTENSNRAQYKPTQLRVYAEWWNSEYKEPTTNNDLGVREFEGIEVTYPPEEVCIYPEYKGKPYFGIKYKENGEEIVGYGTYNPEVLSRYLKDYFISTTKNNVGVDCIDRTELLKAINTWDKFGRDVDTKLVPYQDHYIPYIHYDDVIKCIKGMPPVTPQEPRCKDCKWWKDSDGIYRRGCRAESQCPINRREVYEGNGYCYMFEPMADMREVEE